MAHCTRPASPGWLISPRRWPGVRPKATLRAVPTDPAAALLQQRSTVQVARPNGPLAGPPPATPPPGVARRFLLVPDDPQNLSRSPAPARRRSVLAPR